MNIKIFLSALLVFLMAAFMQGCASSDVGDLKLENCEAMATNQEKIDCRLRNRKALDEFDKENRRDPLYRPRPNRNI